ncbi:MAG: pyruvate, water dikinase regulatory protein [Alphaproteobacteria bacterium]
MTDDTKAERFHLHLVSDSTGETLNAVAGAVLAQFEGTEAIRHAYVMVRTSRQLDKVMETITSQPGIVLCTMVNQELEKQLLRQCADRTIPCVPVLDQAIASLSKFLGTKASHRPGGQHTLNEDYFQRIEALNFTLAHDDGQMMESLDEADIVLVGVSRTSKTPTCMYLAHRGIKAANVPIVPGISKVEQFTHIKRPLVVGLTVNPDRLVTIRKARLRSLNESEEMDYTDMEQVKAEMKAARRLFSHYDWPVLDVTRRSVEEASAAILTLHDEHKAGQHD